MAPSRWLADEMVGRLARYLRFVGLDTLYARGLSDEEILRRASEEGRILVTRDRALARRAPRAVLLTSPRLSEQWAQVRAAHPEVPFEVRFDRCTECNGLLRVEDPASAASWPEGVPRDRVANGLAIYRCEACGHLYWEGTHTARIRTQLAVWAGEARE